MATGWKLITDIAHIDQVQVFSGGSCNILDARGHLLRNSERDSINDWLTAQGVAFFDPQIHPDTHGTEYDYAVHHPLEMAARKAARINLFEISPRTFGGVAAMEIAVDKFHIDQPTVIFFSDGNNDQDLIPVHSADGYPVFEPHGILKSDAAMHAHYREFIKNANRMRRYLLVMAQNLPALTVTFGERAFEGDVIITPDRMHAVDIFQALVDAGSGRRVIVTFTGGDSTIDSEGNPIFRAPQKPPPARMRALLDQYVDEGSALRRAICDLIRINVFARIVYTQAAAVDALGDLLRLKGMLASKT
ncbi:MAG: hypothetical protein ACOCZH_04515 [Phototrophicaceae bacterium]